MKIIRKHLIENNYSKTIIRKTIIRIENCSNENYSNRQLFEVKVIRIAVCSGCEYYRKITVKIVTPKIANTYVDKYRIKLSGNGRTDD